MDVTAIKKEIKHLCDLLKDEKVDYSMSFIFGKGKHDGVEHISAKDDHHMLDLINNQLQLWTKLNHK